MSSRGPSIVWYRGHDLRVEDNPALLAAVQRGGPVLPVFVWAPEEDGAWCLGRPGRWWLQRSLAALDRQIRELGCASGLIMRRSKPELGGVEGALLELVKQSGAEAIFWNRVYDPVIMRRDEELRRRWMKRHHLIVESFKAELLVEPWEVGLGDGGASNTAERALETFH
ncbi:Cryptochrome-1 [Cyanidiococcus yangmingshanensis]|uniref:Cryptochrome-1 n=1 Tax=Cyanidiococcus yangmingshanensis TaxID=2690220 RepID=A0A7J7IIU3_9RHOD|nr:Cryptochrome-1 [Cyanidiococcus yangmingshanensis]